MSTENQNREITQEDLRNVRHTGFVDSVAHMDQERQQRLAAAYAPQDARRERNIAGFYDGVLGQSR